MHILYGRPPRELAEPPKDAVQTSPLIPGSTTLEALGPRSAAAATVLAPPGAVERRYVLALALRALAPGGRLFALAPKDRGGSRLARELAAFGCRVEEEARRHHRLCTCPAPADPTDLAQAIEAGAPRLDPNLGLWTQPGVFSWDRLDPGSLFLSRQLPPLAGRGADFGCGLGVLSHAVLSSPAVLAIALVDIDRRAADLARRNVDDVRASFHWADLSAGEPPLADLDFVVMNPPFHAGGREDRDLGQLFIRRAAAALRPGGACWLVANRHLPYEAALEAHFKRRRLVQEAGGYKVYEAVR
jgi:16S rRNA (guanine1207-N2)-methyltransferase